MRGIGVGQTIHMLVPQEVDAVVSQVVQSSLLGTVPRTPQTDMVTWLICNSLRAEKHQSQLLSQQNLRTLWRRKAIYRLQQSPGASMEAADALRTLRDHAAFTISNGLPGDRPLTMSQSLQQELNTHQQWLDADSQHEANDILGATHLKQYNEGKYSRQDEKPVPWPLTALTGSRDTSQFFYPLQDFAVMRGAVGKKSPLLKFPPYCLVSENYYKAKWRWRSLRRLKNIIVAMEWVPDTAGLKLLQHEQPLTTEQLATLRTAFEMFDSDGSSTISRDELREMLLSLDTRTTRACGDMDAVLDATCTAGGLTFDMVSKALAKQSFFQLQGGRYEKE
eukprot:gene32762-61414_t